MSDNNKMISDEAVEAAAKAAYEVMPVELFGEDTPVTWEQLSDSLLGQACKAQELRKAKQALEAAGPYMLAAVADEREGDLFRFTLAQREWLRTNPYRSHA